MNWARAYVGFVIVALGTVLLLGNAEVLDAGQIISSWWPAPIVLGGLLSLVSNPRMWVPPTIIIAIGTALLLRTTGVVDTFGIVMPIALIVIGLLVVFGRGFGGKREHSDDTVDVFNLFSGSELASHSKRFEGGRVSAVFGGSEIDLRDAVLAPGATIDVFVAFGGVELRVLEGWRVDISGMPLFGAFENATAKDRLLADAPILRINGTVLFGALEVKH
jgi:hypothetical protein